MKWERRANEQLLPQHRVGLGPMASEARRGRKGIHGIRIPDAEILLCLRAFRCQRKARGTGQALGRHSSAEGGHVTNMAFQELPPRHLSFPFIIPVSVFVVIVADPVVVSSLHVSHAYDAFHASIHPIHPIHPRKSANQTAESLVSARLTPLHPFVSSILRLPPPPFQSFQPITNRDLRSQLLPVIVLSHRFPLFAITAATISRRAKLPRHTDAVDVPTPHFCSFAPGLTAAFISSQLYMEIVGTLWSEDRAIPSLTTYTSVQS